MRLIVVLFAFLALIAVLGVRAPARRLDSEVEAKDLQNHPFSVEFPSGNKLRMHLRSGEFHIIGRDDNEISIRVQGRNADNAKDLTVRFQRSDGDAEMRVFGGPKNDLQVNIEVPKAAGLFVRMPAGQLSVEGVSGDKDIELHAGELTIAVGKSSDYSQVDASVLSGELDGAPFSEYHGGLFRSFHKTGTGRYKLHAHVGAGQLTLRD